MIPRFWNLCILYPVAVLVEVTSPHFLLISWSQQSWCILRDAIPLRAELMLRIEPWCFQGNYLKYRLSTGFINNHCLGWSQSKIVSPVSWWARVGVCWPMALGWWRCKTICRTHEDCWAGKLSNTSCSPPWTRWDVLISQASHIVQGGSTTAKSMISLTLSWLIR